MGLLLNKSAGRNRHLVQNIKGSEYAKKTPAEFQNMCEPCLLALRRGQRSVVSVAFYDHNKQLEDDRELAGQCILAGETANCNVNRAQTKP